MTSKKSLLLIFCIFFGIGVMLILFWKKNMNEVKASDSWLSTTATIVEARVDSKIDHSKDKIAYLYSPKIKYEFSVNNNNYFGSRITFGDYSSNKRKDASKIIRKYSKGSKVTVYYNPANPYESVLLKKAGLGNYILLAVGILFVIGGIGVFLVFLRRLF